MSWIAFTVPTALFFGAIVLMIAAMAVWQWRSPAIPRRGLLPMETTPGDRFFVALLGAAFVHMAWLTAFDGAPWPALLVSVLLGVAVLRFG